MKMVYTIYQKRGWLHKNMKNKIKTISIAILFALIALIVLVYINTKVINKDDTIQAVIAVKSVAHNTQITSQNVNEYFKVEKINSNLVTGDTLKNMDGLVGKYVSADVIYDKATVNSSMFSSKKDIMDKYDNPVRLSFSVSSFSDAVCGRIRTGDFVDIYGVSNVSSQDILKSAYVEGVYDSSGVEIQNSDTTTTAVAFTVIINSGDENKLLEMIKNSKVVITKVEQENS